MGEGVVGTKYNLTKPLTRLYFVPTVYLINYIYWISCRKVWVISSFFAICHGLNDKGLHDFEK
jgi:hypothetical protein